MSFTALQASRFRSGLCTGPHWGAYIALQTTPPLMLKHECEAQLRNGQFPLTRFLLPTIRDN